MITRYVIAARRVIQDSQENDFSIVSILDDFVAQAFPLIIARIGFLWGVEKEGDDPEEFQPMLRISVDEEVLFESPFLVSFQGRATTRAAVNLAGFKVPRPGRYQISAIHDGQVKATYVFRAAMVAQTDGQPPQPPLPPGGVVMVA